MTKKRVQLPQLSSAHQAAIDSMPPLPAFLDARKRKTQTAAQKKLDVDFRREPGSDAPKTAEHDAASLALNDLSEEGRAWVEQEIAAHRFNPHWLLDKSTISFIETKVVAPRSSQAAERKVLHKQRKVLTQRQRILPETKIEVKSKTNPYREASIGHAVFSLYKSGMTIAQFERAAAGLTKNRKPIHLLMFDVRKGNIILKPTVES